MNTGVVDIELGILDRHKRAKTLGDTAGGQNHPRRFVCISCEGRGHSAPVYFFTKEQLDLSSGWNALSAGTVARSL